MAMLVAATFFGEVAFKKGSPSGQKLPYLQQKNTDAFISLIFFTILGLFVWPFIHVVFGEDNKLLEKLHDNGAWEGHWSSTF